MVYSFAGNLINDALDMYGVGPKIMGTGVYWFCILLCPTAAVLPDYIYKYVEKCSLSPLLFSGLTNVLCRYVKRMYFHEPYDIVKEMPTKSEAVRSGMELGTLAMLSLGTAASPNVANPVFR